MAALSRKFLYFSVWFAAGAFLVSPAAAITVANSSYSGVISPDDDSFLGAHQSVAVNLTGVVSIISAGIGSCTGALLADGTSILTAGHCVSSSYGGYVSPNVQVTFQGPNNSLVTYTATSVAVDPNWDGTSTDGGDLAVIQLGALAPAFATEYQLDMEPAVLGAPTVLDGYGYGGTGVSGDCPTQTLNNLNQPVAPCPVAYPFGTLRAGENEFVETGAAVGWSANMLVGQFYDSTDPSTNALGATHPFSASDEVDIAFGDSGGSAFQDVDGTFEIVGVNDVLGCVGTSATCNSPDPSEYSSTLNSSFGQIFAETSVLGVDNENLDFIEAQITPEPHTFSLMIGALLASLLLRMRRSEPAPAEISPPQRRTLRRQNRG